MLLKKVFPILLFYCLQKNERTVSDLNRQCLMRIIPIYWGQLDQRGIKGEEGGGGARLLFQRNISIS